MLRRSALFALLWLLGSSLAGALPAAKAQAHLYVRPNGAKLDAAITVELNAGWHLYYKELGPPDAVGKPTVVTMGGEGFTWGEVQFPKPKRLEQPGVGENGKDTWIWAYEGSFTLRVTGTAAPGVDSRAATAKLRGLTCDDGGMCIPLAIDLKSEGPGPDEIWKTATAVPPTRGADAPPTPAAETISISSFLLLAIAGGLFTLLMPCTYPMIPITISFFTKQATVRGGQVWPLALAYGGGIVLVFVLIGAVFGSVIVPFATHPITNLVIGGFFLLFALSLFGAVDLPTPRFLLDAAGSASQRGGYLGVFLMGTTLVVTSFTCTAPFVGSLLSVGAQQGQWLRIVLGMAVFGLTMAVPFVLLSLLPGRLGAMPRSGEWMHTLKVFLGFVELAAALKFLSNVDLVWQWGLLSRELFLVLWFGIFAAAALYLFGLVRLEGDAAEIRPLRLAGAVATLLFSVYCGYGALGNELDSVMTAIAPNYSKSRPGSVAMGGGSHRTASWPIVVDDYDAALEQARSKQARLLVNFTGHT